MNVFEAELCCRIAFITLPSTSRQRVKPALYWKGCESHFIAITALRKMLSHLLNTTTTHSLSAAQRGRKGAR